MGSRPGNWEMPIVLSNLIVTESLFSEKEEDVEV